MSDFTKEEQEYIQRQADAAYKKWVEHCAALEQEGIHFEFPPAFFYRLAGEQAQREVFDRRRAIK